MLSQTLKAAGATLAFIATLAFVIAPVMAAPKVTNGNNGTLKVHEIGTTVAFVDNDPKVCAFNLEAFGLDAGQTGYLQFGTQGNDAPHGTAPTAIYAFGPANSNGYAISRDFNNGTNTVTIPSGHYKVTLYGKMLSNGQLTDVKAKSKVFKVACGQVKDDCDTTTPVTPTKPDEGGSGGVSGQVLGEDTQTPNVTPVATTPQVLENTGTQTLFTTVLSMLLAAVAVYVMRRPLAEDKQARFNAIAL